MKHSYKKEFKNVLIRPLEREDIEFIRNWRNNPKNTEYLSKIPYITEAMQQQWFERYLNDEDEMTFAIIEKNELNIIVGSLSLYNFTNDSVEFGKILIGDERAHGNKVGLNAINAVLSIVFNELNKEKVYLHVYSKNIPAAKVYKSAGFLSVEKRITNGLEEELMCIKRKDFEV